MTTAQRRWGLDPNLSDHTINMLRSRTVAALRAAPWLWADGGAEGAEARRLVPEGPPALPVGVAPLLTVNAQAERASLWALGGDDEDAPLIGEAAESLKSAAAALGRTLPVLWRALHTALEQTPARARLLISLHQSADHIHQPENRLDGRSLGLSVGLALASRAIDQPLPADLAASATLDLEGVTGPVQGLADKLLLVALGAPGLRRVLLHPSQLQEAHAHLDAAGVPEDRLKLLPAATLHAALVFAFGDDLPTRLLAQTPPEGRAARIDALFHLALSDHSRAFAWEPIARTAAAILAAWPLNDDQRRQLELTRAIAERHAHNSGDATIPPPEWLDLLPAPPRVHLVAHLVQQSADTGTPPHPDAEALATHHLVRGLDAFPPHLRLLGANARLVEAQGRHAEALLLQREALEGWLRLGEHGADLSYPLSAVYRLAAGLDDAEARAQADDACASADLLGGPTPTNAARSPFVCLWRAVAQPDTSALDRLAHNLLLPTHLRASAQRQRLRLLDNPRAIFHPGALADPRAAATFAALAALDHALRYAPERADDALQRLRDAQPHLTAQLCANALRLDTPEAAWVARWFPY